MTPLLHGGLVALKLNSLSNAVMQEGTFMDSARDNIIKVCYYINSNISWHGAGGEGGRIKAFPGELRVGYPSPGLVTEADGAWPTSGVFQRGQQISRDVLSSSTDLHVLTSFSSQTSATPLFPTPPLPPAFPTSIFPSFPPFCLSPLAEPKLLQGFWSPALTVCGHPQTNSV